MASKYIFVTVKINKTYNLKSHNKKLLCYKRAFAVVPWNCIIVHYFQLNNLTNIKGLNLFKKQILKVGILTFQGVYCSICIGINIFT